MRRARLHSAFVAAISSGSVRPRSRSSDGPPTAYRTPSMTASTPRPVSARNPLASRLEPSTRARATIALASGCSLSASTAAAIASTSASVRPAATMPVTTWLPFVSVPVLSKRTASTVRIRSSASRSLTRMPCLAATAVESAITRGIARPSACGQAITSTVTVVSIARGMSPASDHVANVTAATPLAT